MCTHTHTHTHIKVSVTDKYTVKRENDQLWTQTNVETNNTRPIREILFDQFTQKRIVWEFVNDKNNWEKVYFTEDIALMEKINVNETV